MAKLSASERAKLPDRAFAYIDAKGRRLLPINDEAHVRNALARFDRVRFESEADRERARKRLLNAAKRYGIVPVGFFAGQLSSERRDAAAGRVVIELGKAGTPGELEAHLQRVLRDPSLAVLYWSEQAGRYIDGHGRPAPLPPESSERAVTCLERRGRPMTALVHDPAVLRDPDLAGTVLAAVRFVLEKESVRGEIRASSTDAATLPVGFVTFMLTDIEGSTVLLERLGNRYGDLLKEVRSLQRGAVLAGGGSEVDARADELFAVFQSPGGALEAALGLQRELLRRTWPEESVVRVRAGLHSGRPTLTETGYIGLSVHMAARVCSAGHGGQIVVSEETARALGDALPEGVRLRGLGRHRLAGLSGRHRLYQVEAKGLPVDFPPLRTGAQSFKVPTD